MALSDLHGHGLTGSWKLESWIQSIDQAQFDYILLFKRLVERKVTILIVYIHDIIINVDDVL